MLAQARTARASPCFCHVPMRELQRWARKRYIEGVPTLELLRAARNPRERAAVGMVALLDVPDEEAQRALAPRAKAGCDVLRCREHVRQWLKAMLAAVN